MIFTDFPWISRGFRGRERLPRGQAPAGHREAPEFLLLGPCEVGHRSVGPVKVDLAA